MGSAGADREQVGEQGAAELAGASGDVGPTGTVDEFADASSAEGGVAESVSAQQVEPGFFPCAGRGREVRGGVGSDAVAEEPIIDRPDAIGVGSALPFKLRD